MEQTTTAIRAIRLRDATVLRAPVLEDTLLAEEVELEIRQIDGGIRRYGNSVIDTIGRGQGASLKPAERLLLHWYEVFSTAVADERSSCEAGEPGQNRHIFGPVLMNIDPGVAALLAMHEAVSQCMADPAGVRMGALMRSIGRAVMAEINLAILAKDNREALKEMDRRFKCSRVPGRINWWAKKNVSEALRSTQSAGHVGAFLLGLLMDVATCAGWDEKHVPAFTERITRHTAVKQVSMIRLSDEALAIIDDGHATRRLMRPRYLPMIVRPYLWTQHAQGGYVRIRTPFIAKPTPTQKALLEHADLSVIYDHLDALSGAGFRVNKRVLAAQKAIWESGGNAIGIPPREARLGPVRPDGYNYALSGKRGCWAGVSREAKLAYKREASISISRNKHDGAAREEWLRKLEVADLMLDRPAFYYPHQLDFRGRAYPIPPHLNHQGDDTARGVLEWSEGKDPGENGRRELLIEAANAYGFDKLPFDERVQWAQDHGKQIAAAARDPIDQDWWHPKNDANGRQVDGAEKPWQFLAAAIALNDPEAAAHACVRRDGTANGLQQYSALSRDSEGARVVNLLPSDRPADVYAEVAEVVRRTVENDRRGSDRTIKYEKRSWREGRYHVEKFEIGFAQLAELLIDHVNRKTIKQPVMTSVYGVTRVGATKQIQEKLKKAGISDKALYAASRYLSDATLNGIGEVCAGAKSVMDWLRECARAVTSLDRPVRWTTPLGLPVVQPYRRYKSARIECCLGKLNLRVNDDTVPVHVGKQCAGFAPNYVHSLDATHMFMAARRCREDDVTFAATHDCYWSHAATTPALDRITRETFVDLHTRPLLTMLADELRRLNSEAEIPDPPALGTLDINETIKSVYFFS